MEQKAPPPPFRLSLISWAAARPSVHDASDAELGWIENRPERSGRFMAHARGRLQCLASSSLGSVANMGHGRARSEEHTSELQSLMRISYAVFCLKKKTNT